jgi:hypothetical protein
MRTKILAALFAISAALPAYAVTESYSIPAGDPAVPGDVALKVAVNVDKHRLVNVCDALGERDGSTAGSRFRTIAITSSTAANDRILATAHGLFTGQTITIASHTGSTPAINGGRTVTVVDVDNFTIGLDITVGGTGGSFTIDCTQGNVCLAKGATGGAACTAAQARAVDMSGFSGRIFPQTTAGREEWFRFPFLLYQASDLAAHTADAVKALRVRYLESLSAGSKDTDCTSNLGTQASCQ